ncbi:MAG: TolC family protein [Bacteroidia bacterium]|nr:TolC family protein [Bacteroidia bacterium]
MKHKILLILLAVGLHWVLAQSTEGLSLSEAKKSALENKTKLKTDKIAQELAQSQIQEALMKRYPQVNFATDLRYNLVRQQTVLPFLPDPIKLGAIFNPTAGVDANYTVYDKKINFDVHQAELNHELSKITEETDKEELINNVVKSYINVLTNQERLAQLNATLKRLNEDMKEVSTKVTNGLIQKIELSRLQNNIDNTRSEIEKQKESILISEQILKFHSGMNLNQIINVTDDWTELEIEAKDYKDFTIPKTELPFYRQQKLQIAITENQVAKLHAKKYPVISLYGYAGLLGLINKGSELGEGNRWSPLSYAGVRLNWNLNPFWENKTLLAQNQIRIMQTESLLKEWDENREIQIAQAESNVRRAEMDMEVQKRNAGFAEENLKFIRTRFQSELVTYKEVADAEAELESAKINEILARYNFITALFDLKKAKGALK